MAANRVMVALGPSTTGGPANSLCVYNAAGAINVIIDAGGWFGSTSAAAGAQYQGIQPTRICDTRSAGPGCAGGALGAKGVRLIVAAGQGGIPAIGSGTTAVAVIANLTAIAPTAATYLTMYPANLGLPLASDINVGTGEVLPNLTVVQLDRCRAPVRVTSICTTPPAASTPSSTSKVGSSKGLTAGHRRVTGGRTRSLRPCDGNVR